MSRFSDKRNSDRGQRDVVSPFKVTFDSCLFTVNKPHALVNNMSCARDLMSQDHVRTLGVSGNPAAGVFAEVSGAVSRFL